MALRMYGQYIIQATPPAEDPVMVGTQWFDNVNNLFKICTSVAPYTYAAQTISTHNLLSLTHPDTTSAAVQRGDLVTGQGATPTWSRLAKGGSGTYLRSNGTDLAYSAPLTTDLSGVLQAAQFPALTGDVTSGAGALATTLATVNANVGSFGGSTAIPVVTVNAKGLITAASTAVVVAPAGTLSGTTLNATVVASSLTSVGTLTGGATGAGFTVALSTSTITGTLSDARLSANVPLLNGMNTFSSTNLFLSSVAFASSHSNVSDAISVGKFSGVPAAHGLRLLGASAGAANRVGFRVVLGDSAAANLLTVFDFDKNGVLMTDLVTSARVLVGTSVSSGAGATDLVIANAASLRGVAASGSTTYSLLSLDSTNTIRFGGDTGVNDTVSVNVAIPQVTSFPGAVSGNRGVLYLDAANNRLCAHIGSTRYFWTPTGTF